MKQSIFLMPLIGFVIMFICQRSVESSRLPRQAPVSYGSCTTPDRNPGECYSLRQCPVLLNLLRGSKGKPEVIEFLRQSTCGFDNKNPRVCCPLTQTVQPTSKPSTGFTTGDRITDAVAVYRNIPSPPSCGKPDSLQIDRIVNGVPANLGDWPWAVALGFRNARSPNGKLQWLCGGALVTNKHVITAAHCTKHPSLSLVMARLGDLDLNENVNDGASPVEIRVRRTLNHPSYQASKYWNDIAIVYLQDTVQFTKLIKPVCLPTSADLVNKSFVKSLPIVIGWGSTKFKGPSSSRLLQVKVPVVENESCRNAYSKVGGDIIPQQICAGKPQGEQDACQGDSGGPLMWIKDSTVYLIGVVSYGYKCAEPGYPGIYTRTTSYLDWINKNLV